MLNAFVVYDLDYWPESLFNNVTLKGLQFGNSNIVKHSDKCKYNQSGYEIAFDGAVSWSFGNNFAGNVVIFGVDNFSSSHTDSCQNNFLALGEGHTDDIHHHFGVAEKKFIINFTKGKDKMFFRFAL